MKKEIEYNYAGYKINITIESDEEEIINAFIDKCFVKSEYYQYDSKIDRGLNKKIKTYGKETERS